MMRISPLQRLTCFFLLAVLPVALASCSGKNQTYATGGAPKSTKPELSKAELSDPDVRFHQLGTPVGQLSLGFRWTVKYKFLSGPPHPTGEYTVTVETKLGDPSRLTVKGTDLKAEGVLTGEGKCAEPMPKTVTFTFRQGDPRGGGYDPIAPVVEFKTTGIIHDKP
jgi:hypothetical protein